MDSLSRVIKLTDYIEAHLPQCFTLEQLSDWLGVSKWHLQREFKTLTGLSIGQYSTGRKLSLAAAELAESPLRIIDVALDYGFESQEAFARAFKRHFGISPKNIKGQPVWAQQIKSQPLTRDYLECYAALRSIQPQIVTLPAAEYLALPATFNSIHHDSAEFYQQLFAMWQTFEQQLSELGIPFSWRDCYSMELANRCHHETGQFMMLVAAKIPPATKLAIPDTSNLLRFRGKQQTYYCFELAQHTWVPHFLRYLCEHYLPEQQLALVEFPVLWQGSDDGKVWGYFPLIDDLSTKTLPEGLVIADSLIQLPDLALNVSTTQLPCSLHQVSERLAHFFARWPQVLNQPTYVRAAQFSRAKGMAILIGELNAAQFSPEHEFHVALVNLDLSEIVKPAADTEIKHLAGASYLSCQLQGTLAQIGFALDYLYNFYLSDSPYYQVKGNEWICNIQSDAEQYQFELWLPVKLRNGRRV